MKTPPVQGGGSPNGGKISGVREAADHHQPGTPGGKEKGFLEQVVSKQAKDVPATEDGRTMGFFQSLQQEQGQAVSDPVVGWLVCIKGYNFGKSFPFFSERNSVGSLDTNRIVVTGDQTISREHHCSVIYDPASRIFYLEPGKEKGLTRLNGELLLGSARKLSEKDVIQIGNSEFLFVPLCGKDFSWENYLER